MAGARIRFGDFELDERESRLLVSGEVIELQPKVYEALCFFAARPGQLITREELMEALWPDVVVNEETLTQVVRKLRRALGDEAKEPRFVATVLKRGYRFLPRVEPVEGEAKAEPEAKVEAKAEPEAKVEAKAEPDEQALPPVAGAVPARSPARLAFVIAGVVTLLAGAVILLAPRLRGSARPGAAPSVQPLAELHARRLTFSVEREQEPALSADGARVLYVANVDGQYEVFLSQASGGNRVRLTRSAADEYYPHFSPDGLSVLFSRSLQGTDSAWTMSALGGDERLLASNAGYATHSPDGAEIAFVRPAPGGAQQVVRRRLADGREQVVTEVDVAVRTLTWSPDGRQLAWAEEHRVALVDAAGGTPHGLGELADHVRGVAWDPQRPGGILTDANWGGRAALWRVDRSGKREAMAAAGGGTYSPHASADGQHIVYTREERQIQLWRRSVGAEPTLLPTKVTFECIDLAPDHRLLAYGDIDTSHNGLAVGVLDLDTLETRELGAGRCPRFSADGKRVAFVDPDGHAVVLTLETGARQVVAADLSAVRVALSPDGAELAIAVLGAQPGLVVAPLAGGTARRLADGSFGVPVWSPDGKLLAANATVAGSPGLHVVDAVAGGARLVTVRTSWAAPPLWRVAAPGRPVLVRLVDERTEPQLAEVALDGTEGAVRGIEPRPDPSFWGVFQVVELPDGLIFAQERYESDVYVLEP